MSDQSTQPITGIPTQGLPPRALVVGDPFRAQRIADLLDGAEEIAHRREYRSFVGSWNGIPVVVSSHGVGGPGAICQFRELIDSGVTRIIRLGTAGSLQPQIGDGDLVLATACVRDDGVTHQMVPDTYPAAASAVVVDALTRAAATHRTSLHEGVVWTRAAFYPEIVDLGLREYVRVGVLAIEMELSALLVLASLRGVQAGGLLVVDGAAADELVETTGYDPHRTVVADGVDRGIRISLDALVGGDRSA